MIQTSFDIQFDLCVIGAGPLGIITALEYSALNKGKKVVLVEYGTRDNDATNNLDDSIIITNNINHHPPHECTNKGLGGTSATWGGRCVNFDEVDFYDRAILKGGCTWNINFFEAAKQYYTKAIAYFECGDNVSFNLQNIVPFKTTSIAEHFINGDVTDSIVERWSMPTRFGKRYRNELLDNEDITLLEGFEARNFIKLVDSSTISALTLRNTVDGSIVTISAKTFVISTGTQEATRLLLRNTILFSSLNKIPHALGKYYQGHISGKIASVKFYGNPKLTDFGFLRNADGSYMRRRFQFSTKFLVENNLLNTAIWLDNPLYHDSKHSSGVMSFMYIAMITPILGKKLAPPAIAQSITKGKVEGIGKHLLNILKDFPKSLFVPAVIFYKRYLLKRKLPGIFLFSPENKYALHFHAEQIPIETNNMQLDTDGETLVINYQITDSDIQSVIQLHEKLDNHLRASNCGELEYWYAKDELANAIRQMSKDGIHQSGTTRIANSPEDGVVDTNLRLFGTDNIYICSSSVLPTSSQANPTFFTGVLAVKLANHLS
ncbi:MAG: GMC oxidoreductase [Flavobacterium sp.]|nr:GMC oxidoreductase [Flavobacterium sp.]